jgi:hypothetical protein
MVLAEMSADPFARKHTADEQAANRKAAKDELAKHKAELAAKVAPKKPFNDLPVYKPKWDV